MGRIARIVACLSLAVLVACSAIVYFGVAFAIGAIDKQRIAALTKKREP